MTFKTQVEAIEHMKRAETILRTYEILKRVKKGSFDNEVITSIMENQTTTHTLSVVSEGEKFRTQELYTRVSTGKDP